MDVITKAKIIRAQLDALIADMTDEQALQSSALFPEWNGNGVLFAAGQRILYNDVLYKVLQSHTSQPDWTPVDASSLFAQVLIPDENVIPEWIQPDSTNPYMTGDKVMFDGMIYESLIDNNIWSPTAYPTGWAVRQD